MKRAIILLSFIALSQSLYSQLFVSRDTINVTESGYSLKMPWANGINFANVSNIDLNLDGKLDLVAFDRINQFGVGRFRCFINTGIAGQTKYAANPDLSYYFPVAANWAVFKDYNFDGKADLFCSTPAGIMVYANKTFTNVGAPPTLSFSLVKSLLYDNQVPPANIYAASNAVPGIADIDNDGDLDILTFSPFGTFVEFYKNLSIETYANNDSLNVFTKATSCWGNFAESSCMSTLNQTCALRPSKENTPQPNYNSLHAGSCLACVDTDGDLDQDLVMGDISCNHMLYAHNGGSSVTANIVATSSVYPNYPLIGNTQQIQFNNFPCAYNVDVDGDGKKDLIATPNATGSENFQSMWYYKNTSATGTVNFQFQKNNLFQDEMIEVGQNSFPVLFDYNADGKKDLLIGTYGYYVGNTLTAKLTLYANTGSTTQPSFSLVTRDYASVLSQSLNCASPTVGDIDGDGDIDILLATQSGQVHWLKNTAGVGAPATFTFLTNSFSLAVSPPSVAVPAAAAPQLFDTDNDGLLDLMMGGKNGRIWYYRNIGTLTAPSFSFITNNFGSVNVQGSSNLYGPDGYASPFFYKEAGLTKLLVGSVSGQLFYYSVPSASVNCNLINTTANSINEGGQSVPFFEDINGDNLRDLFVGNGSGGISFFSSKGPDVGINELTEEKNSLVNIFPNPVKQTINIRVDRIEVEKGQISITDILGKEIYVKSINSNFESIEVNELQPGIYFVKVTISNHSQTVTVVKKIIKE